MYFCSVKGLAKLYLRRKGWVIKGEVPKDIKKYVLIAAPHTAASDFFIGRAAFYELGIKRIRILIKKEMFVFPIGFLLKAFGALPIDRKRSKATMQKIKQLYEKHDEFVVLVTPEGTRRRTEKWKKGFYYIATAVDVPIVCGYMDYAKKEGGIGPTIYPSGNFSNDMKQIYDFYRDKAAKYPDDFFVPELIDCDDKGD